VTPEHEIDEWLRGAGPEEDTVVCTRVRLARNLDGFSFSATQSEDEAVTLLATVRRTLSSLAEELSWTWVDIGDVSELDRQVLIERHLISRELSEGHRSRGVLYDDSDGRASVMVNEEDHLRLQVFRSGLRMEEAWEVADELDDRIASLLPYAFSNKFGYLTSCPTNTGTGLRISVLVHLPALVTSKEISKATNAIQEMNMVVRGLYGEGSHAIGDLFQISNQRTLGESEEEILRSLHSAVLRLLDWERKQRREFLQNRLFVEDRAYRALGTLERARTLSSEETISLLSALRLGRILGVMHEPSLESLNQIFLLTQPAHLQQSVGRELPPSDRDLLRAEMVRRILS